MLFKEWLLKEEEEDDDMGMDLADQIQSAIGSVAMNSYRRTRVPKGYPSEIMGRYLNQVRGIRDWIQKTRFPVNLENLDLASQALADAILDFRRNGGIFEPASYVGGADPRSAEHLSQFAQFLRQRMNQPKVYGKQWGQFPEYWDAFMEDFSEAAKRWKAEQ
jgi:hypothetical protein